MAPPEPALAAIGGLSGTGKSVLARALAPSLPARARRSHSALGRDAQADVRRARDRQAAAGGLHGGGDCENLFDARRAGAPDRGGRPFGAGRCGVREGCGTQRAIAAIAARSKVRFRGLFLTADLETRDQAGGRARQRRLGCRCRGGAQAGAIRSRPHRLDWRSMPPARRTIRWRRRRPRWLNNPARECRPRPQCPRRAPETRCAARSSAAPPRPSQLPPTGLPWRSSA